MFESEISHTTDEPARKPAGLPGAAAEAAPAGPAPDLLAGQQPRAKDVAPVMAHWAEDGSGYVPPGPEPPRVRPDAAHDHGEHGHEDFVPEAPAKDGEEKDKKDASPPEMSGIATSLAIGRFIKAAKEVQKDWASLKTEERADKLGKAANDELKAVKVTETTPVVMDLGGSAGKLGLAAWELKLGKGPFSAASLTDAQAADVADTVYHESRHAEQWYRMARLQAGKGKKADEITKTMGIPARVVQDAVKDPLAEGSAEAKEAGAWWESVYGAKAAHRNTVLQNLRPLSEAVDKAQAEYDKIKDDKSVSKEKKDEAFKKWTDAYTKWKENREKYLALPEEADAWKVGGKVTAAYLKK